MKMTMAILLIFFFQNALASKAPLFQTQKFYEIYAQSKTQEELFQKIGISKQQTRQLLPSLHRKNKSLPTLVPIDDGHFVIIENDMRYEIENVLRPIPGIKVNGEFFPIQSNFSATTLSGRVDGTYEVSFSILDLFVPKAHAALPIPVAIAAYIGYIGVRCASIAACRIAVTQAYKRCGRSRAKFMKCVDIITDVIDKFLEAYDSPAPNPIGP